MQDSSERVLIVRIAGLGDIATATTLLTRLREEAPTARVTWMCGLGGVPLVRLLGIDDIIAIDEQRLFHGTVFQRMTQVLTVWKSLMADGFDRAYLIHADRRYRLLLAPVPNHRVRVLDRSTPGRKNPVPGRFFGDEFARLADPPNFDQFRPQLYEMADLRNSVGGIDIPAEVPQPPDVILVPGGARNILRDDPLRRWPLERYGEVARALIESGHSVGIVGDRGDAWVRSAFTGLPVHDFVGRLDIPQTLKVLAKARVVISHDTGPMHLARLVRAPLIALFGPTTPRQVLGDPEGVTILWGGKRLACRPCYDGRTFAPCPRNVCLEEIRTEAVVAAAIRILDSTAGKPPLSSITSTV